MAFVVILPADIDSESPVSEAVFTDLKGNDEYIKSALTDGASASQALTISTVTAKAGGTALTVDNNAQFTGDVNVDGTLVSKNVFFRDQSTLFYAGF